jgi:colanic acid/amylovoran biosynthesis glycosyltransferase
VKPPVSKIARFMVFLKWIFKHFFKIKWHLFFKIINAFVHGKEAYTLKLFFESQWFLLPYNFSIIHAHFGMNGNRIAYLKAHGILPKSIKLINTFHGYDLAPNKMKNYEKEYAHLLKEANVFTVNTPYLLGLLEQINIYKKSAYVLPVGLDTTFFLQSDMETKDTEYFDLVFCGKLILLKGPDLAIDILRNLHQKDFKNVRLHIIGDGILKETLTKQVRSYSLEKSIFFYGGQSQHQLKKHFTKADAFILPGRYELETGRGETQGLVIQEAQAMELPVIVSDVGGMAYGLLPNESGFVVAEEDIDGFTEAVKTLILNPELKLSMGKKGRQYVKKYDTAVLAQKLQEIYTIN